MSNWTANDIPDQTGKIVVITGANSGLGYETVLALARKNAHVVMTSRSIEKGEKARAEILKQVPNAQIDVMQLDLANLASIREFVEAFINRYDRLDQLYNNAGVMALPKSKTADGFEMQFGTNHLGHFALTGLLLPKLLSTPNSRVVSVSSGAYRTVSAINFDDLMGEKSYSRYGAYGQSKLANILFASELNRLLVAAGSSTRSMAAHPGLSHTNLQSNTADTSGNLFERAIYSVMMPIMSQSQGMGALPQLYAGTSPNAEGGKYYGPSFLGVRGYPHEEKLADTALDEQAAARLWALSKELTGVTYDALQPVAV
ncbi:MAG: SDR family NAD(P)-dependent oxidoreductase [Anaerolineae bacterium]|nr:SDR family NAD(P)-dependent oxidoreductase [Anaerolineae bacterium]